MGTRWIINILIFQSLCLLVIGECPVPPPASSIVCATPTDTCRDDQQCSPGFKCCNNPCGKYCAINLKRRFSNLDSKGTCPIPPDPRTTFCAPPMINYCLNDSDCTERINCCHHPCGNYCAGTLDNRIREKPGYCPRIFGYGKCRNGGFQCVSDSECFGRRKCCKTICGFMCVVPKSWWYFDIKNIYYH